MLRSKIKSHCLILIVFVFAGIFFFIYSWLYWQTGAKFNSPDENANYFFIQNFVNNNSLKFIEQLNLIADKIIHPRSVAVVASQFLVPSGFVGLICLFGLFAKFLGLTSVLYLTPLLASFSSIFFYLIVKRLFSKSVGLISFFLFLFLPPWWYNAERGLLPNVSFVALFLIGWGILFLIEEKYFRWQKNILIFVSGFIFGLSLFIRPTEIIWISIFFLIFIIYHRKKIKIENLIIFFLPIICFVILLLMLNSHLYGSPFSTGYNLTEINNIQSKVLSLNNFETKLFTSSLIFSVAKKIVAPFGFHPHLVVFNVYHYFIKLFWPYFFLFIFGFIGLINHWRHEKQAKEWSGVEKKISFYLLAIILSSLFLFNYYGSWLIFDNINKNTTIGVSYLRYWLPIFIFGLPMAGYFLDKVSKMIKNIFGQRVFISFVLLIIFIFSAFNVFSRDEESLVKVSQTVESYKLIATEVNERIEPDAILLVERADKIFWPERAVIVYSGQENIWSGVKQLILADKEVYYYLHTELTKEIWQKLNERILSAENLYLTAGEKIGKASYLYAVKLK